MIKVINFGIDAHYYEPFIRVHRDVRQVWCQMPYKANK